MIQWISKFLYGQFHGLYLYSPYDGDEVDDDDIDDSDGVGTYTSLGFNTGISAMVKLILCKLNYADSQCVRQHVVSVVMKFKTAANNLRRN